MARLWPSATMLDPHGTAAPSAMWIKLNNVPYAFVAPALARHTLPSLLVIARAIYTRRERSTASLQMRSGSATAVLFSIFVSEKKAYQRRTAPYQNPAGPCVAILIIPSFHGTRLPMFHSFSAHGDTSPASHMRRANPSLSMPMHASRLRMLISWSAKLRDACRRFLT